MLRAHAYLLLICGHVIHGLLQRDTERQLG